MPRYKPLKIIPTSYNFSSFEDGEIDIALGSVENALKDYELEQVLVSLLKALPNDRYRSLFLLQVLRHSGYNLPHEALYKHVFKVHRSWYFRMVKRMQRYVDRLHQL